MQLEQALAKELAVVVNERIEERISQCMLEIKFLLANLPKPERGEKGERGERGEIGPRGETGLIGRDGFDGKDGAGGKDGKDGENLCLDDVSFDFIDDGSTLIARFARGNIVKEAKTRIRGKHCGPWKQNGEYFRDDSVTSGGSSWFAVIDAPKCRPGDGKDWILYARKGRDGDRGERGPPGVQGPPGKEASW